MNTCIKRTVTGVLASVAVLLKSHSAGAHLATYEGERVRNDNHFTTDGFAAPVRGECDITASGPIDPKAGSANEFLGPQNDPANFFCSRVVQDDWSFAYPAEIIENTRTPAPDPTTVGEPLEEGYIPCSPTSDDPYQCPRVLPRGANETVRLSGRCVDLGQPDDPATPAEPDGVYHCALMSGAPRPRISGVLFSTLAGPDDVDWAVYRYDPVFEQQPIVGAPQVPACRENLNSFVTFAYAGPLHLLDARSGEPLFVPVQEAGPLPAEVLEHLPEGYGVRVKRPSAYRPSPAQPRPGYASGYAQNAWLLAQDAVPECIDKFEKCLADQTGELSKHYNYNDIFFLDEPEPVDLYLVWWSEQDPSGPSQEHKLIDVSITTGVIDQFTVGDFMTVAKQSPLAANGRYLHGRCTDPRANGEAEILLETN